MKMQVETLQDIEQLRFDKRALVCPRIAYMRKPKPAAIVINFSGTQILQLIRAGLYVYEKK